MTDPKFLDVLDLSMYTDDDKSRSLDLFDLSRIGGTLSHLKKSRVANARSPGEAEGSGAVAESNSDADLDAMREQATQIILEALTGKSLPRIVLFSLIFFFLSFSSLALDFFPFFFFETEERLDPSKGSPILRRPDAALWPGTRSPIQVRLGCAAK